MMPGEKEKKRLKISVHTQEESDAQQTIASEFVVTIACTPPHQPKDVTTYKTSTEIIAPPTVN